jgi:hypothetical protein
MRQGAVLDFEFSAVVELFGNGAEGKRDARCIRILRS